MNNLSTNTLIVASILLALAMPTYAGHEESGQECIVLLHGLARTRYSMKKMERRLTDAGYKVINIDYPSREHPIEELSEKVLPETIGLCREHKPEKIHFVTHSLGGILLRYYLQQYEISELGRVVMLSPPNKGSEVVDKLSKVFILEALNGPAALQLGTEASSIPNTLGKVDFDLGVITGDRSINLINSGLIIPGEDDGKVSVERAKVEGMNDFLVAHTSHPYIMKNKKVIKQTIHFLQKGEFLRDKQ